MAERTWRIVTPEAVALDLEAAGLASRITGAVIDVLCLGIAFQAVGIVMGLINSAIGPSTITDVTLLVIAFLLVLAWPIAWEVLTHGRSPGKLAVGTRVVTLEGAPIRFRHALVRGLVGFIEVLAFFGVPALIVALSSRRFRRLGDHLAGTVVIRDRSGTSQATAVRFLPMPGWEPYADALDVSRLTSDHHRLIRSFLLRAPNLDPVTRARLGGQILDELVAVHALGDAERAALAPYDPVLPLTSVAAAYQRRFSPDPLPPGAPSIPVFRSVTR